MSEPRLRMDEFDYELPPSSIAHVPAEPRDSARLLVDRGPDEAPDHHRISDLASLLGLGDLLVVNDTRVMPARLPL
ncbi:S-adenosylmethionine:tRNA ribosyltransferase-isomerase, partial [Candidatus Poriferisodalis multihospitum]|uniref:S-adenosylmethionine:tRNA ribosyltransferase-isomerase n=1 Tax=Candidatus Poriferisodalis multihospitum TaxID=2983191 RepID=UPI002B262F27